MQRVPLFLLYILLLVIQRVDKTEKERPAKKRAGECASNNESIDFLTSRSKIEAQ